MPNMLFTVFFVVFSKTLEFAVFCASRVQKYWYLQHFLRFCMTPAKDVKAQKCCNLQHFVIFEKRKILRKMCRNGTFSDFRYPQNRGLGECSWRHS